MTEDHSENAGTAGSARLPLEGIKVLDLSRVLAGPWATMSLADLGAEVWKIENIDGGDDTRAWSVPSYKGVSTYYLCANRGKQSIALDMKSPQGLAIVRELAAKADIVVENFRSGTADRLGVGFKELSAPNPRLIYCSISGYGQTGPDAGRPGYDFVMQAESGLMAITGESNGEPMRVGVAITVIVCGMVSTQSILAALYERATTGKGQFLDLSLIDCALSLLINIGSGYLNTGREVARYGNAHPTVVPYQIFEASDGGFALAVGNDRQFAALCEKVLDLPHLAGDARFIKAGARATNREALIPELAAAFKTRTRDHWMATCAAASVPAGTVKSIPEVFDSPNVRERGLVQTLPHPHLGSVAMVRPAQGLAAQLTADFTAPPMLGQDTAAVLADVLGYSAETIDQLIGSGAVSVYAPAAEPIPA
ncbi:CoA transferase [Mesorhizobium sp. M7A.F.Ca.CA.002.05.1.1]|uniref:CaiB/BaiF CoA transferase family protein n=1 Tax=Mesorhizobium sp. M7A.F.Ca.CA.002.05.1.1 TaxID=2496704 RepID=UPI000FCA8AC3|nr:CaiB/BaiF CoA-transferase family protein [Mesorhizobium sp. M7A.F.Ca.CA.002.05.1.1]RVA04110.1 CoA transferase [Mesorhizobium sp. M7A.F.Ca.CA.002.05.1.1]